MRFEFATATRIIFGQGTLFEVAPLAASLGKRAFVVTGQTTSRVAILIDLLTRQDIEVASFSVAGEPTTSVVQEGVQKANETACDFVIGIGGGSVLDAGKAIAALLTNGGEALDYLEIIGQGKPITKQSAPYIAIPTTAGTGAEVTRNAVLVSEEHKVKVSLRSPLMLPQVAIIDPELTHSMPPAITASTGLDALTQVMEPFVSNQANPLSDAICRQGLVRAGRSLWRVYEDGSDATAREDVALASLMGGLALANAKLGAVHGFAGVIGGMYPAPHGVICARLLPYVMEANVHALHTRASDSHFLTRYEEVAQILTGDPEARPADGVGWVHNLCQQMSIPKLSEYGMKSDDFPTVAARSEISSSMKGNPIELRDNELIHVLDQAVF